MRQFHPKYPVFSDLGLSKAEGGNADAIYARPESPTCDHETEKVSYETAHVHPVDNSLYMLLSPADACTIIDAGWGRRFPVPSNDVPRVAKFLAKKGIVSIDANLVAGTDHGLRALALGGDNPKSGCSCSSMDNWHRESKSYRFTSVTAADPD